MTIQCDGLVRHSQGRQKRLKGTAMYSYKIEEINLLGMMSLKLHQNYRAIIVADDGVQVTVTNNYPKESTARLQGARKAKAYEEYYKRTGKRFELEDKAKKEDAKRKARIAQLETLIPKLQAELAELKK